MGFDGVRDTPPDSLKDGLIGAARGPKFSQFASRCCSFGLASVARFAARAVCRSAGTYGIGITFFRVFCRLCGLCEGTASNHQNDEKTAKLPS